MTKVLVDYWNRLQVSPIVLSHVNMSSHPCNLVTRLKHSSIHRTFQIYTKKRAFFV